MLGCISHSLGLVCYQEQARCRHQLHSLVLRAHLYFHGGFLSGVMCISSFPSSGTSVFLEILIKGLLMGKYVVSGPPVVSVIHRLTAYSSVPLKLPWHRKIHH